MDLNSGKIKKYVGLIFQIKLDESTFQERNLTGNEKCAAKSKLSI